MKVSSQHRALYCYLILSVWIFLLVAGMYKYIGNEDSISALKHTNNDTPMRSFSKNLKPDIKTRRIFKMCNPPEDITIGNEVSPINITTYEVLISLLMIDSSLLGYDSMVIGK